MYECDINHWSRRDMSALIYQAKCLMLVISTCWLFAYSKTLIRRRILFVRILLITRRWRSFLLSQQQLCRLDYTHLPFFSIRFRHHHLLLLATAACAFTKKKQKGNDNMERKTKISIQSWHRRLLVYSVTAQTLFLFICVQNVNARRHYSILPFFIKSRRFL